VPLRVIVLDTLAASGLLKDENNNAECGLAMAAVGALAQEFGVLFIVTHHPPKSGTAVARGGGALEAAADYVLQITRFEKSAVRQVELSKGRNCEQRKLGAFSLVPVTIARDARGRALTTMTVSMGEPEKVTRDRAPTRYKDFVRAMDLVFSEPEIVEGEKAVRYQNFLDEFKGCTEDITDRSNQARAWRTCLAYAQELGVVAENMVNKVRYVIKKETTDD